MSKASIFRAALATLCGLFLTVFLAACGGGGDDGTSVPAGAQVCELKDYIPPSHPPIDPGNFIRSSGDGIVFSVDLIDGGTKYALANWQPFYVSVSTSTKSLSGLVNGDLIVPVNKRSTVFYYNYLGTLNGRHVRGTEPALGNWIVLGRDSSYIEDQVSSDDVAGIEFPAHGGVWPDNPHVMSEPQLTQLDQHLFRVQEGFYQGVSWSRLPNATIRFEVFSVGGYTPEYKACELRGLTDLITTVAITGGLPGKTYIVRSVTYASLDDNIQAYSKPVYVEFQY